MAASGALPALPSHIFEVLDNAQDSFRAGIGVGIGIVLAQQHLAGTSSQEEQLSVVSILERLIPGFEWDPNKRRRV